MDIMQMLMATAGGSQAWSAWYGPVKIVLLVIMAIASLFIILVVLFQPGNSSGVGALGGQTETFLEKNKGKTFEHKMKKLTVVSGIIFVVLCVVFAIVALLAKN